jgi:hypothetical protein
MEGRMTTTTSDIDRRLAELAGLIDYRRAVLSGIERRLNRARARGRRDEELIDRLEERAGDLEGQIAALEAQEFDLLTASDPWLCSECGGRPKEGTSVIVHRIQCTAYGL